jgi:hypothetical protein
MTDNGEPGPGRDAIAIEIRNSSNAIVLSNNWINSRTVEKAIISGGLSVQSGTAKCTITTSTARASVEEEVSAELVAQPVLRNYPNPFRESTTLEFTLAQEDAYTLDIYDAKGALVERVQAGSAQAGVVNEVVWNAGKYPVGVYLARLTTSKSVQHIKLVVR